MHLPTRHTSPSVRYRNPFLPPLLLAPPRPANKQSHSELPTRASQCGVARGSFGVSVSFDPVAEPPIPALPRRRTSSDEGGGANRTRSRFQPRIDYGLG